MSKNAPRIAGVAWFERSAYPRALEVMEDAGLLPTSYDEWLARAEVVIEQLRRQGRLPVKIELDPERFLAWCKGEGVTRDSDARAAFIDSQMGETGRSRPPSHIAAGG